MRRRRQRPRADSRIGRLRDAGVLSLSQVAGASPRAGDLGLLYAVYFAFVGASGPWFPLLFDHWGMTAFQIGALVALSHLIRIVAPPVWGWAADRRGQVRSLLQAGALIMAMMCLVLPQAGALDPPLRFAGTALAMAVLHLAAAGQGPLTESMSLRLADGDLGHYGRMRVWGSVGFIVAVVGLGTLLDAFGVTLLPFLLAAIAAGLVLAVRRLPPVAGAPAQRHDGRLRDEILKPTTLAFLLASLLMILAHAPFYAFFSLYLAHLGYAKSSIGLFWALGVVAEIGLFLMQKRLFDRFPATLLLLATMLLGVLRFTMTAGAAWLPATAATLVLILAQVLHAATFALHHSASMSLMHQRFGTRYQARAQSLYTAVSYGLGGAIGGLGAGVIWQTWGPGATFHGAAIAAALGAGAALLVHRGARRESRAATSN
jgi:MFS transporter, PPP family, 3-phenylpropionic acid transporter